MDFANEEEFEIDESSEWIDTWIAKIDPVKPRELILSKSVYITLNLQRSTRQITRLIIIFALIIGLGIVHIILYQQNSAWRDEHLEELYKLQNLDFPHVRTLCVVFKSIPQESSDAQGLTFPALPYGLLSIRFQQAKPIETFLECYLTYYAKVSASIRSFSYGIIVWDYDIMHSLYVPESNWCIQNTDVSLLTPDDMNSSDSAGSLVVGKEDCLSLSIRIPKGSDRMPKAVVILVTGQDLIQNKPHLPEQETVDWLDCIIVTVNYRLGVFGSLRFKNELQRGNLFVHDVKLAVNWVSHQIGDFSGDPTKITYFGQNSGGTIGFLLLHEKTLAFQRMWLLDGSIDIPLERKLALETEIKMYYKYYHSQLNKAEKCASNHATGLEDCMHEWLAEELLRTTPDEIIYNFMYLSEFPKKNSKRESLIYSEAEAVFQNTLESIIMGISTIANNVSLVLMSSSKSGYYWNLFEKLKKDSLVLTRRQLEDRLQRGIKTMSLQRNERDIGKRVAQAYVDWETFAKQESDINYAEINRVLLHDVRTVCPYSKVAHAILWKNITTRPIYRILDTTPFQSILHTYKSMPCDIVNFMSTPSGLCNRTFPISEESQKQQDHYRKTMLNALQAFAQGDRMSKSGLVEARVPRKSSDVEYDSTINVVTQLGIEVGSDTPRSSTIKYVCREYYGDTLADLNILRYGARRN